jgi:hypothetical protein
MIEIRLRLIRFAKTSNKYHNTLLGQTQSLIPDFPKVHPGFSHLPEKKGPEKTGPEVFFRIPRELYNFLLQKTI